MALTESADMLALLPGADSFTNAPPGFAWQLVGQQDVGLLVCFKPMVLCAPG